MSRKKMKQDEKNKGEPGRKRGSEGQPIPKQFVAGAAEADESERAQITDGADVEWAAALLVPWGFKVGKDGKSTDEPLLRPPARVVMPILRGLIDLDKNMNMREVLKR